MRRLAIAAVLVAAAFGSQAQEAAPAAPATEADSINSAVADFIAANLQQGIDMVFDQVNSLGLEVDSALVLQQVSQRILSPYDQARHRAAAQYLGEASRRALASREARFMEQAKAQPGAQEIEGGLVLRTLQPGVGPNVMPDNTVTFHYVGKLPDGTVFDDTTDGAPLTVRASGLVTGMTNGLTHMNAGGRYVLTIPSELAYGSRGAGDAIPPDTPLEFTIEIVEIQ